MDQIFEPHWYGNYELLRPLGVGGMAEVFLARTVGAQGFEKVVVLKRMLARLADQPRFVKMFVSEAKLAVQLSHANIVQILGLEELGGRPFIVMEYVHGRDLHALLRTATRGHVDVPTDFVLHALTEMLRGLGHAHEATGADGRPLHLIHRDVTPSNVFISFDGAVKLGDFGVAHSTDESENLELRGKHGYLAPELLQRLPLDHRADLFGAGVVLWEALAGKRLFVGRSDKEVLLQVRDRQVEPPSQHNPRVPPDLDQIALRALHKDREQRFQSAREFEEALSDYLFARRLRWTRRRIAEVMRALFPVDSAPLVLPPPSPREGSAPVDEWEDFSDQTTRSLAVKLGALSRTPTRPPDSRSGPTTGWHHSIETGPSVFEAAPTDQDPVAATPWQLYREGRAESLGLDALCARLADPCERWDAVGVPQGPRLSLAHFGQLTFWDTLAGLPVVEAAPVAELDLQQVSLVRVIYEASVRRTSALFVVESESGNWQRWLWVKGGYPQYIASDRSSEGALPTLLHLRQLQRAVLEQALDASVRRLLPLDRALQAATTDPDHRRVDSAFAVALCLRLVPAFGWRRGRVRAYQGIEPSLRPSTRIPPLLGILVRAVRRAVAAEELQADLALRSHRGVVLTQGRAAHLETLRLGPEERAVIDAIDGHRNLDEVLLAAGCHDAEAQHAARALLYVMAETGLAVMA